MDRKACEATLICNALAYSRLPLDMRANSNFRTFIEDLSLMLAGITTAVDKVRGVAYPNLNEVDEQVNILMQNIMPALIKASERKD